MRYLQQTQLSLQPAFIHQSYLMNNPNNPKNNGSNNGSGGGIGGSGGHGHHGSPSTLTGVSSTSSSSTSSSHSHSHSIQNQNHGHHHSGGQNIQENDLHHHQSGSDPSGSGSLKSALAPPPGSHDHNHGHHGHHGYHSSSRPPSALAGGGAQQGVNKHDNSNGGDNSDEDLSSQPALNNLLDAVSHARDTFIRDQPDLFDSFQPTSAQS